MFELALGIALCVVMGKVASTENRSGLAWGFITLGLLVGCLFIPLPFLRVLIAGVLSVVAMTLYKIIANR